jgi:hypothetical protein
LLFGGALTTTTGAWFAPIGSSTLHRSAIATVLFAAPRARVADRIVVVLVGLEELPHLLRGS